MGFYSVRLYSRLLAGIAERRVPASPFRVCRLNRTVSSSSLTWKTVVVVFVPPPAVWGAVRAIYRVSTGKKKMKGVPHHSPYISQCESRRDLGTGAPVRRRTVLRPASICDRRNDRNRPKRRLRPWSRVRRPAGPCKPGQSRSRWVFRRRPRWSRPPRRHPRLRRRTTRLGTACELEERETKRSISVIYGLDDETDYFSITPFWQADPRTAFSRHFVFLPGAKKTLAQPPTPAGARKRGEKQFISSSHASQTTDR